MTNTKKYELTNETRTFRMSAGAYQIRYDNSGGAHVYGDAKISGKTVVSEQN